MRRSAAIVRHDLRVLRHDPFSMIVLIVMPLILMAFVKPAQRLTLAGSRPTANGAEQAVPGMAILFGFFLLGYLGLIFFREHGWNTWHRLRASQASPAEVIAGKVLCPLLLSATQLTAVFLAGGLLFGAQVRGSLLALVALIATLALCVVTLALMLVATIESAAKMNALGNLISLVFAGFGGAISPVHALPGWAQALAPFTPSYWAMRGFLGVFLDARPASHTLASAGMVLLFSAGFAVVAATRFRVSDAKVGVA